MRLVEKMPIIGVALRNARIERELESLRVREDTKYHIKSILKNTVSINLFKWVMHFISVYGSSLYLVTFIIMGFMAFKNASGTELSLYFRDNLFIIALVLGALVALAMELSSVGTLAEWNRSFRSFVLAIGLMSMQVATAYYGVINTAVLNATSEADVKMLKALNKDYKAIEVQIDELNKKLNSAIKGNFSEADRELKANKKVIALLEKSLADAIANYNSIKQDFNRWQMSLVKKYKLATVEELKTLYRTKYPLWEKESGYPLKLEKAKEKINQAKLELAQSQNIVKAKDSETIKKEIVAAIKSAEQKRDDILAQISATKDKMKADEERVREKMSSEYLLYFIIFIVIVQALIEAELSNRNKRLARALARAQENHARNERNASKVSRPTLAQEAKEKESFTDEVESYNSSDTIIASELGGAYDLLQLYLKEGRVLSIKESAERLNKAERSIARYRDRLKEEQFLELDEKGELILAPRAY